MSKCREHTGTKAVTSMFGGLCEKCEEQVKKAQANVRRHVSPKECFITYEDSKVGWRAINGTGCAHWVAHERNIKRGAAGAKCEDGFTMRVPELIAGVRKIDRKTEEVKTDDIWAYLKRDGAPYDHCGLVVKVEEVREVTKDGENVKHKISIRHCASTNEKGVVTDDFEKHFKGKGDFYRL